jgi:lia operon protein LiaG
MSFRPASITTAALLATLPLAAALAQPAGTPERAIVRGDNVAIFNVVGRVRVEPSQGGDVTVNVTRGGRDASRLAVRTSEIRGRNTFVVQYPDDDVVYPAEGRGQRSDVSMHRDGTWTGEGRKSRTVRVRSSGRGTEAWADLVIAVPAGKTVAVYLAAGTLVSNNVDGTIRLDVHSATVDARGHRGALLVDAGSGGVTVRDAQLRDLTIDVGSGDVSVDNVRSAACLFDTGSGDVNGSGARCDRLRVDVGSGDVTLADVRADDALVDTGSGSVRLGMAATPASLTVDTGSGAVTVTLPDDLDADVDIESGSGDISSEFPVQTARFARNTLRGTIGNGGAKIRVDTGSGAIALRRAEQAR